ncbi:MAG: DUF4250 family protein [Lachnospiraceae bacterium]
METKREIRRKIRQIRRELDEAVRSRLSEKVAALVITHPWFLQAEEIYTYVDYNGEAGTRKIIETAIWMGKSVWVPKVTGDTMHFYCIGSLDELRPGAYGIPEPAGKGPADGSILKPGRNGLSDCGILEPREKSLPDGHIPKAGKACFKDKLMVMPGVAFDRQCHRVGYGGGYYDRYLFAHQTDLPKFQIMALAFEFQILPEVPHEEHDMTPEIVVTEKRILRKDEKNMQTGLPKDPMLLLSVVNMKLRDYYSALDIMCEDMGADKDEIIDKLRGIGYEYDEERGQFVYG